MSLQDWEYLKQIYARWEVILHVIYFAHWFFTVFEINHNTRYEGAYYINCAYRKNLTLFHLSHRSIQ